MESSKGPSNIRNTIYNGKHALLPPKSPLPTIYLSYADYAPSSIIAPKGIPKSRDGSVHHHRTSSESFLIEEQPSWLDDLLNEPGTPVRKGHRRSSSDSFAYVDAANFTRIDHAVQGDYKFKNLAPISSWTSQEFDHCKDVWRASHYVDPNSFSLGKPKKGVKDSSINLLALPHAREKTTLQRSTSSCVGQEAVGLPSSINEEQEQAESGPCEPKAASEKKDTSFAKPHASEKDTKRTKQQFAQRSRVRKLQYIAELERNLQAFQEEGSEVSADLDFLNQQNLILSMENKALNQRLESLAQEHLIKCLEHEVLEREIGRLRALYQLQCNQQQQPRQSSSHRRTNSRDLDLKFANLSLKHKDASSGQDPVSSSMHI